MPATSAARWSNFCDVRAVCRCVRQAAVGDLRFCGDDCGSRRGAAGEVARALVPNPEQHIALVSALRYIFSVCCFLHLYRRRRWRIVALVRWTNTLCRVFCLGFRVWMKLTSSSRYSRFGLAA